MLLVQVQKLNSNTIVLIKNSSNTVALQELATVDSVLAAGSSMTIDASATATWYQATTLGNSNRSMSAPQTWLAGGIDGSS